MKKIQYLILVTLSLLCMVSCSDTEKTIYNPNFDSSPTLLSFSRDVYDFPINLDETGTLEMTLNSSSKSSTDRTYNVEIDIDNTNANSGNYTVPGTVTIPADSFQGTLTVDGLDDANLTTVAQNVQLSITGIAETEVYNGPTNIRLFQVCNIPDTYLIGQYLVEDVSAQIGPANSSQNFEMRVMTVSQGITTTSRVFTTAILPGIAGDEEVTLNLVCGEIILGGTIDPGIACTTGTPYIFTAAATNSTYSIPAGDNTFIVNYTEDPNGSCGGPFNSSFRLTKQ